MTQQRHHKLVFEAGDLAWRSQPIKMDGANTARPRVAVFDLGTCTSIGFQLLGSHDRKDWCSVGRRTEFGQQGTCLLEKLTDLRYPWLLAELRIIGDSDFAIDASVTTSLEPTEGS